MCNFIFNVTQANKLFLYCSIDVCVQHCGVLTYFLDANSTEDKQNIQFKHM